MTRHESGPELVSGGTGGLRVHLLGGFRVVLGERVIEESEWRLRKAAGLFKLLALSAQRQLHREQALELLWPDLEPRPATNNFHGTLHTLRRILEPDRQSTLLRLQDDVLTLGPSGQVWVDMHAFEAACRTARSARDTTLYYTALKLYAGELLPGDRYEDWAASRREHLHELYISLLLDLARLHEASRELSSAIEALRRVVEGDRSHEEGHMGLMRLYALSGQRQQALRQYGQLKDALLRDLDAEPEAESERLYQEIHSGLFPPRVSSFPVAPTAQAVSAPRHNLPAPLTSFIGREHEVAEVRRLLATTRLLTLVGTGGCGKTRLALEVARASVPEYADGVCLVELAGLSDARLVTRAVADVAGVAEDSGRPLMDALSETLWSKRMLLILDNCEHLLDACAHLAETLLTACPDLRVLATSREALDARGELHWRVPSLAVPPAEPLPSVEQLSEYGAVRLFIERARHRQPGFDLATARNAQSVVEICRQLDGIPLAIELATSRIPVLSVTQIAARLGDSLGLLTGGGRMALPRHRTLRGVLDWSYALLTEAERKLFARLSVFADGWTLEAAEAVGSGEVPGSPDAEGVLDVLSRLVDRSLVQVETGLGDAIRYRLLESVRQYAQERLEETGEGDAARPRHAGFFIALAEDAEPELTGPGQVQSLGLLETEHDNLRAALSWSLENELSTAGRLVAALWRFWWVRGHLSEGRRWLGQTLASPHVLPTAVQARALRGAGVLAWAQGELEEATRLMERSLALFRELEDKEGAANALSNLGTFLGSQGEYERARGFQEESLALSRELGKKRGISLSLGNLGETSFYLGDHAAATAYWEESLPLDRELGDMHGLAITLNNLGDVARNLGDLERAEARFEEAVALFREMDARSSLAQSLQSVGDLRLMRREYEEATELLRESLVLARDVGNLQSVAYCLDSFAKLALSHDRPERAARLFGAAEGLRQASGATLSPVDRWSLQPSIDAARSALAEPAWSAALAEGKVMTQERAIGYALSPEDPSPPVGAPTREVSSGVQPAVLTRREREIVGLVSQGLTNRRIAHQLLLSERTVDTHTANILRKLGLRTRAQVAEWAAQQGLFTQT